MIKPRALRPGDRIALISPASSFSRDEFDKGAAEIRRLGYEPTYEDSVFERSMFTSGPAAVRTAAFVRAWSDPSIAALMAVRGGYGSMHLLPLLDGWRPQETPKLFIGYSDNTSILSWLTCQREIAALHGPMVSGRLARGPEAYDEASFTRLIRGEGAGLRLQSPELAVLHEGDAEGPLYGGTLTQLTASLGTPWPFDPPRGCVLFLEDVNERPFRIDRMLTQLRQSGILSRASALVFGEMRACDEPGGAATARSAIEAALADVGVPTLFGFPAGHTTGPNVTLPLGVRVRVDAGANPSMTIEESPVA